MERLEREIRKVAKRVGLPAASELVRIWPQVVGETIAANAWPARLNRKGVLQVNTSSATWAFELKHLAPQILAKLERELASECPSELRFAPGPVPGKGREAGAPRRGPRPPHASASKAKSWRPLSTTRSCAPWLLGRRQRALLKTAEKAHLRRTSDRSF
jgi:hypothetical protein